MAAEALRYAFETIDFTLDPPLSVPDKYKNMVWFALPLDIAMMMVNEKTTGEAAICDVNSIPFIPDDAKVSDRLLESLTSSLIGLASLSRLASLVLSKQNQRRLRKRRLFIERSTALVLLDHPLLVLDKKSLLIQKRLAFLS